MVLTVRYYLSCIYNSVGSMSIFLAAHRFNRLWAFLCPGVFKVFDRVEIAGQKSQSDYVNKR